MSGEGRQDLATSELKRLREGRDLWISRSHLYGFVVLVVVASAAFFLAGFVIGRDVAPAPAPPVGRSPADEELARILATIDVTAHPSGLREIVQSPTTLERSPPPPLPQAAPPSQIAIPAGPPTAGGAGLDRPPAAAFTVTVGESAGREEADALERRLTAHGLSAWTAFSLVDGVPRFRVAVGGFPTAEEAEVARKVVAAAGFPAQIQPIQ